MEILAKIRTEADLAALKASRKALADARETMRSLGKATDDLDTQIDQLDQALASEKARAIDAHAALEKHARSLRRNKQDASALEREMAGLRKQFGAKRNSFAANAKQEIGRLVADLPGVNRVAQTTTNLFGHLRLAVLGWIAALVALIGTIAKSLKAFDEKRQAVDALNQSMANAGEFTNELSAEYQQLATDMQRATGIADTKWIKALARLHQFGARKETIGVNLEALKNLLGLYNGDMPRAMEAYGKALQGQFDSLRENGIVLDAHLDKFQKLEQLHQILAQRGAGLLEARLNSQAGQWSVIKNEVSDLLSKFGQMVSSNRAVSGSLSIVGSALEWWNDWLVKTIPALDGLRNATGDFTTDINASAAAISAYADKLETQLTAKAEKAAAALAKVTAEITRQQQEADRVADAQLALELAQVKNSDLSDVDKLATEQQLRQQAAQQKFLRSQQAAREQIAANNQFAGGRQAAADRAGNRVDLLDQARQATANREGAERTVATLQQQIDEAQNRLNQIEEDRQGRDFTSPTNVNAFALVNNLIKFGSAVAAGEELEDLQGRLQKLEQVLATANERLENSRQAEGEVDRQIGPDAANLSAAALAGRLEAERRAAAQLRQEAEEARRNARDQNAAIASEAATESQVFQLQQQTTAITDRGALQDAERRQNRDRAQAFRDVLDREVVNSSDPSIGRFEREGAARLLQQFEREVQVANQAIANNGNVMVTTARQLANDQHALARELAALRRDLQRLDSRSDNRR